jgi:Tol biopolymer transport system component
MQLLEKNPADRPQSADEVRRTLDRLPTFTGEKQSGEGGGEASVPLSQVRPYQTHRIRSIVIPAVAALVGVAAGAALVRYPRSNSAPQLAIISALAAPPGQELRPDAGLALSPDGARLAFIAEDKTGTTAIWVRALDTLGASRLEGTEGGTGPFWSPDGQSLGYFGTGQLRVVDLRSGSRRALCPASSRPGGGTWTTRGVIVYSADFLSVPLFQVPAAGGACTPATRYRAGESVHRRPSALPDGRHVLFSEGRTGATTMDVVDLSTGKITDILPGGGDAQFVAPDWVLFREGPVGPLYAQRLDLASLRLTGEPSAVLDRVVGVRTLPSYAASSEVLVALQMNPTQKSVVWVDRRSVIVDSERAPTAQAPYFGASSVALSHNGRRIAFTSAGPLWIFDRDRGVATQAHTGTIPGQGILEPAWDPGDSLIAYRTLFTGNLTLRLHHVVTDTSDSLFSLGLRNFRTPDWSPDGKRIVFQLSAGDSVPNDEIWIYSLADKKAARVWESPGNLSTPRWSPDGRWMAYVSDETGSPEVYVRAVAGGVATRVSSAGGEFPFWRADGRELYYRLPDGAIMAVSVQLSPSLAVSSPRVVLADPPLSRMVRSFQLTPDGQRFVGFGREDPLLFTLVTNWRARVDR